MNGKPTTDPTHPEPVFIVGPARSGTTLLGKVLSDHPAIHITDETHYFDDLRTKMKGREKQGLTQEDTELCIRYFRSLSHLPYGLNGDPEQGKVGREELHAMAKQIGKGADAFFEAYCRITASKENKPRWGEKTPRHVFRIRELLETHPRAKIICMMRDPRAVVASYRDWQKNLKVPQTVPAPIRARMDEEYKRKRKSYHPLIMTLMWKATASAILKAQADLDTANVYVLKYENLVQEPAKTIQSLCQWIGVPYETGLGDELPMWNSSYTAGFLGTAVEASKAKDRWHQTLTAHEIAVIQTACGRLLADLGYERHPVRLSLLRYAWSWVTLPLAVVRATLANRGRVGRLLPYMYRRIKLALG